MKQFFQYWLALVLTLFGVSSVFAQLGTVFFDVVYDRDSSCTRSAPDEALPQMIISARNLSTQEVFYMSSDSTGGHTTQLMRGTYEFDVYSTYNESLWQPCSALRTLFVQGGGVDTVFLGLYSTIGEPLLTTDLTSTWLKPCDTGWVNIAVRNVGASGIRQASYTLTLDESLIYIRPTLFSSGFSVTPVTNHILQIDCNRYFATNEQFHVLLHVAGDCQNPISTYVYKNSLINTVDTLPIATPIAPKVEISIRCLGLDSIQFLLRNRGGADMPTNSNYIVIEDDVMLRQDVYQLRSGQTQTITLPSATNKTYRMEARQPASLPAIHADSLAWSFRRSCDSLPSLYNTRYANEFYTGDVAPLAEYDVRAFDMSAAAIHQTALPVGYGAAQLIEQGTPLEYIINFQNTTSSFIPSISIVDTLSEFLDPTTFEPMASTQKYVWGMTDKGRVQIYCSTGMAVGEKGFFSFKIRPKSPLPLGTVIPNVAYVNLGFAAPVATNVATHTIGNNFIRVLSNKLLYQFDNNLRIYPNPVGDRATFELMDSRWGVLQLDVFNELGQLVSSTRVEHQQRIDFERNNLAQGVYFYRLLCNGTLCDTGKIILR